MKKIHFLFLLFFMLTSFDKTQGDIRLVFEEEKSMRSSFCMYSDGQFYETRPSGCVEQEFSSGYWENKNDIITLTYKVAKVFNYDILKSFDTSNKYQIVKVVDCYNQPVRFQNIYFDTTYQNLYNPGILKIEKGKSIFYPAPIFNQDTSYGETVFTKADTIIYKWHCNRESIESINGGTLFTNQEAKKEKVILKSKNIILLSD